jgi:hypothetical protein
MKAPIKNKNACMGSAVDLYGIKGGLSLTHAMEVSSQVYTPGNPHV